MFLLTTFLVLCVLMPKASPCFLILVSMVAVATLVFSFEGPTRAMPTLVFMAAELVGNVVVVVATVVPLTSVITEGAVNMGRLFDFTVVVAPLPAIAAWS